MIELFLEFLDGVNSLNGLIEIGRRSSDGGRHGASGLDVKFGELGALLGHAFDERSEVSEDVSCVEDGFGIEDFVDLGHLFLQCVSNSAGLDLE